MEPCGDDDDKRDAESNRVHREHIPTIKRPAPENHWGVQGCFWDVGGGSEQASLMAEDASMASEPESMWVMTCFWLMMNVRRLAMVKKSIFTP